MDTTTTPSEIEPTLDSSLASRAADESTRLLRKLHEKTDAVVESIRPQINAVSDYARNDPTRAILMSAAAGAALMGLIALVVRSPSPSSKSLVRRNTLASIRDAALDLADRAQGAATSAINAAHQRASDAAKRVDDLKQRVDDAKERVGAAQERAGDMADAVADRMAETWKSLREQAAPVVDKLRPHLDAAAAYAKEDPARVALGVAAAGAVLLGVLALIRDREGD